MTEMTKKANLKFFALLLAVLMLLPFVTACKPADDGTDTTTGEEVTTAPPPEPVTLDLAEYIIVRESDYTDDYKSCVRALRTGIEERTGVKLDMTEDYVYPGKEITPTAKEIIIGNTNRPETAKYRKGLREKDFVVTFENDRVVILGGNAQSTMKAVEYFLDTFVDSESKNVTVYTHRVDVVRHDYAVGSVSINGVMLEEYRVVYAKDNLLAKYAAENFASALLEGCGVRLDVEPDTSEETKYEILIGTTNRKESLTFASTALGSNEYVMRASGSKIVLLGDGYMVGGGASVLLNEFILDVGVRGSNVSVTLLEDMSPASFVFKEAKNAIIMIGDGMGRNHIEAAKKEGMNVFFADTLPNVSTCMTYSYSVNPLGKAEFTDSAAAATALSSGYKTINGYVGMDHLKKVRKNVRELACEKGARTAVLTTDVITGATPAGFTAHCDSRKSTELIQSQIDELIRTGKIDFCEGSVGNSLTAKAKEALSLISADGSSFFMMLEEAYIDKNSHKNKYPEMISAVKRYNDAIAYVIEFVIMHPDTALIITADHETGGVFKLSNGSYTFTRTTHSNANVPIFTLGYGTEELTNGVCNNVNIAKFVARIFGETSFGD